MDQQSYDAAQRGLLECYLGDDQEQLLQAFLGGLRRDSRLTEEQICSIETMIREAITGKTADDSPIVAALSEREEAVLKLLARGYRNREIADKFNLSAKTVETYKSRALIKLGLATRVDIVRYARKRGWYGLPFIGP